MTAAPSGGTLRHSNDAPPSAMRSQCGQPQATVWGRRWGSSRSCWFGSQGSPARSAARHAASSRRRRTPDIFCPEGAGRGRKKEGAFITTGCVGGLRGGAAGAAQVSRTAFLLRVLQIATRTPVETPGHGWPRFRDEVNHEKNGSFVGTPRGTGAKEIWKCENASCRTGRTLMRAYNSPTLRRARRSRAVTVLSSPNLRLAIEVREERREFRRELPRAGCEPVSQKPGGATTGSRPGSSSAKIRHPKGTQARDAGDGWCSTVFGGIDKATGGRSVRRRTLPENRQSDRPWPGASFHPSQTTPKAEHASRARGLARRELVTHVARHARRNSIAGHDGTPSPSVTHCDSPYTTGPEFARRCDPKQLAARQPCAALAKRGRSRI